ncbi:MAG: SusD/RagB family nutrient-binding outer membrane lipoprotein [Prevotellaceae bacterium]|jgi:hypothetical protein|nr:SusD/RagB family nutrient-binding outer membrane lipoprotein [Prevotellaceae bacterium]
MKKITIILLLGFLSLGIQSCDKFFDVNTSPNSPANAPYYMVFPRAVLGTASVTGGQYAILGTLWSQHFTQSNTAQQYLRWVYNDVAPEALGSSFNGLYVNGLRNYSIVRQQAAEAENWKYYLMATVMEAYTAQVLTDLHEDIPFAEALLAVEGNVSPKYDKSQDVYDALISRIDEALSKDFTVSTNNEGDAAANDKIFGGNIDKWIQFANTLKLRIYLRQIYARESVSLAGITSLLAENNFLKEDAKIGGFENEAGKYNPLYGSEVASSGLGDPNIRGCNTFLNFMNTNSDARLSFIYKYAPSTSVYRAIDYGSRPTTNIVPNNSLSRGQFTPTDPVVFLSKAESQFLQAEAKEWKTQSGKDNYDAGVLASFAKYGLDGSAYIAAGGVYEYPSGTFAEKQAAIITQKWVDCAITNPIESYLEYNRTGYPDFLISAVNSIYTGVFPKRLPYPSTETDRNPNTPINKSIGEKIWWNK